MTGSIKKKVALITGSAGFIGFHVSKRLLDEGWQVIGIDCLSDYYDIKLKENREEILVRNKAYTSIHRNIEEPGFLMKVFEKELPQIVIHLAAQAGVRYSIDNPRSYLESNIIGTFELLEAARRFPPAHSLLASTSATYGASTDMPFKESEKADHQISFYGATKKSTENIAHAYSHLFKLPITMFRFFTVYGPWGRPDMALFKFTNAILKGEAIDVYNYGEMRRDFTYIDDLVEGIRLLIDAVPQTEEVDNYIDRQNNGKSPVAPYRIINIGNSKPEKLNDFILFLEKALGHKATKNLLPQQPGDLPNTWADTSILKKLVGYSPNTRIEVGVKKFVEWYKNYYRV